MPAKSKWTLKKYLPIRIFSMWAKVDLNPEQLVLLIAQLEPGNTSTEIILTVPWSYTILVIHLRA
jgi:hypothetical protein